MSASVPGEGPFEMRVGPRILRLHSRVFEIFSTDTDSVMRWHVDTVGFEARDPDGDGR